MSDIATSAFATLLRERRLPHRYRKALSKRFGPTIGAVLNGTLFRAIRRTPPITVVPDAGVEIHSVTCHRDLDMYLLAIKSFLRFYARVAAVVHDDGTLTEKDVSVLRMQLPGVRVIGRQEADQRMDDLLAGHPACRAFRAEYVGSLQVYDYALFSRAPRIISLDSDIVFVRRPVEVLDWIEGGTDEVIYNQEPKGTNIGRMMRRLGWPCHGDLNCGFLGYQPHIIDLDVIERGLLRLRGEQHWRFAQGYIDLCVHRSGFRARPLSPDEYVIYVGQGNDVMRRVKMAHFIRYMRFAQLYYPEFAFRTIVDLL